MKVDSEVPDDWEEAAQNMRSLALMMLREADADTVDDLMESMQGLFADKIMASVLGALGMMWLRGLMDMPFSHVQKAAFTGAMIQVLLDAERVEVRLQ